MYGIRALGLINYNKLLNIRKLFYSNYKVLLLGSISHTVYVIIRVVAWRAYVSWWVGKAWPRYYAWRKWAVTQFFFFMMLLLINILKERHWILYKRPCFSISCRTRGLMQNLEQIRRKFGWILLWQEVTSFGNVKTPFLSCLVSVFSFTLYNQMVYSLREEKYKELWRSWFSV